MSKIFMDGTGVTPGTQKCRCDHECEFPCWQRLGIAPPCGGCGCALAGMDTQHEEPDEAA